MLFFAPANQLKEKGAGRSTFDIGIELYTSNLIKLLKFYFYYNIELIIIGIVIIFVAFVFRKKFTMNILLKKELLFYIPLSIFPLFIVAVSPLLGTRLLFFSTVIFIIILYKFALSLQEYFKLKFFAFLFYAFLIIFFIFSLMITYGANQNYIFILSEIKKEKEKSDDVILKHSFNYFNDDFGTTFNRKILLESGKDYIDENANDNKSMELNLMNYYHLKSLKEK